MGNKRFYCDYCDCSFPDGKEAREKHRNGVNHKRNRAEYYDLYSSAEVIFERERWKTPCRRHWSTGDCPYGPECRFSHLQPADLQALAARAAEEALEALVPARCRGKSLSEWIRTRGGVGKKDR